MVAAERGLVQTRHRAVKVAPLWLTTHRTQAHMYLSFPSPPMITLAHRVEHEQPKDNLRHRLAHGLATHRVNQRGVHSPITVVTAVGEPTLHVTVHHRRLLAEIRIRIAAEAIAVTIDNVLIVIVTETVTLAADRKVATVREVNSFPLEALPAVALVNAMGLEGLHFLKTSTDQIPKHPTQWRTHRYQQWKSK